jgi:predicted SnoaL-like aldol condensation-catalyzing enzyme
MHSMAGPVEPQGGPADSRNLRATKEILRAFREEGLVAGTEKLILHSHEGTVFRLYAAEGEVLRGPEEVRAFFRRRVEEGSELSVRAASFEEDGDIVTVNGTVRMARPGGGLVESQISWTFRFHEGRLDEVHWSPREWS